MKTQWYKDAIIYGLDIKVFYDANGDGIGDFDGLNQKIDHFVHLGINCIWLLPFHPSPKKDNGYDVSDYLGIDEDLGNLVSFQSFIAAASENGIKVIMDLVVNHTSIEHEWFQSAASSRHSPYRDYYVWRDKKPSEEGKTMFDGMEDSIWEYSASTKSYYLHKYFKDQADLNIASPQVRSEVIKIMDFWLRRGISGFRIDAAHTITDPEHIDTINFKNLHQFFTDMRTFLEKKKPEAILLGESSAPPEELEQYFIGEDDKARMHMLFNFLSNKHTFLAFARKEGATLARGLGTYEAIDFSHWVNFVRHHDELNLMLLEEEERKEVWKVYAPDENMRLFGRGIRRRLAPMLNNSAACIKLFYAVTFSLPGTPLICFGEEIAMGDDLSLNGRNSVRTPMQWANEKNGGFSAASAETLYRPVISEGDFCYSRVNMKDQRDDQNSFYNWMRALIKARKMHTIIGNGQWQIVEVNDPSLFALLYLNGKEAFLTAFNFSDKPITTQISLDITYEEAELVFADDHRNTHVSVNLSTLQFNPHGYKWIKLRKK